MRWTKNFLRRFRGFSRFEVFHCEIEAEINFHIEMRTQENIEMGMLPEAAKEDALERFGDIEQFKTLCKEARQAHQIRNFSNVVKPFTWLLAAGGLVISWMEASQGIRQVGHLFVAIAILLRLFLYAKQSYGKYDRAFPAHRERMLLEKDAPIGHLHIED